MKELTLDDVELHPGSSKCEGFLFLYEGGLYRALRLVEDSITPSNIGMLEGLPVQKSEQTDYIFKWKGGKYKVLKHKYYDHMVRMDESDPDTIKDVLIKICELNISLIKSGYILYDLREGNMYDTIDGWLWVDLGGIRKCTPERYRFSQARIMFLINRYLLNITTREHGNYNIVQSRKDVGDSSPFIKFIDDDVVSAKSWETCRDIIAKTNVNVKKTHWSDNYGNVDLSETRKTVNKTSVLLDLLDTLDYKTVTDVACNKGHYSFYAAERADSVIGFDIDEGSIAKANALKADSGIGNVTFAVKTIESILANKRIENMRFASDLVMAMAIVHHIEITPQEFVDAMSSITKKYLILEEIHGNKVYENILVSNNFKLIKRWNSNPRPRKIALYERVRD